VKLQQFYITSALGALALVMAITSIIKGKSNQSLIQQQQQQQAEINRGQMSIQIGQNLLRKMAEVSLHNDKIKAVLAENGFTVTPQPTAGGAPAPAPTPAPTPVPAPTPAPEPVQ